MHPFERFTDRAKKVLELAQDEAGRAGHSYIGTEHLLLALLEERAGLAALALAALGVDESRVREAIAVRLAGPRPEMRVSQIMPTSRVKKVLALSFEAATGHGSTGVGTEHILLGMLVERECLAAVVLRDLGVSFDELRAEIERQRRAGPPEELTRVQVGRRLRHSQQLGEVLARAAVLATRARAAEVGIDHVERAIADWRAALQ